MIMSRFELSFISSAKRVVIINNIEFIIRTYFLLGNLKMIDDELIYFLIFLVILPMNFGTDNIYKYS